MQTPSKAIEILTELERTLATAMSADGIDAIELGIEALKRVKKMRTYKPDPPGLLLPGEEPETPGMPSSRQERTTNSKGG